MRETLHRQIEMVNDVMLVRRHEGTSICVPKIWSTASNRGPDVKRLPSGPATGSARKWVEPIDAFSVPRGCSTSWRRQTAVMHLGVDPGDAARRRTLAALNVMRRRGWLCRDLVGNAGRPTVIECGGVRPSDRRHAPDCPRAATGIVCFGSKMNSRCRRHRPAARWLRHQRPIRICTGNFLALEMATVGQRDHLLVPDRVPACGCHVTQLRATWPTLVTLWATIMWCRVSTPSAR